MKEVVVSVLKERNVGRQAEEVAREAEQIFTDKVDIDFKTWSRVLDKMHDVKE